MYALAGVFVGVAGLFQFSVLEEGDPTGGVGKELRIIAAVVIGGGSLSGGRGSVLGTLCGALLMAVIDNGCSMLQIADPVQDLILGDHHLGGNARPGPPAPFGGRLRAHRVEWMR